MFQIVDAGDTSICVYLAERADESTLTRVLAFVDRAKMALGDLLLDVVPSYCSVTVYFDLLRTDYFSVCSVLRSIADDLPVEPLAQAASTDGKLITLPVYYGGDVAPDALRVAQAAGMCIEDVAHLHAAETYRVFALGFRPGFAFMGSTPEPLRLPRLDTPRKRVPAGAVAIAGAQAAIYPSASPGGWNLIGRCPTPLFSCVNGAPSVLLAVGDRVRFKPVEREEYLALGGQLDA